MAALDFSGQATPVKLPDFSASATPVDAGPPLTLSVKPTAPNTNLGDLLPIANVLAGQPAAPALDMSNLGTPAETARALGEQFVGGGGQLLDKVHQFLQSGAGRENTGPVGAALADLIADRGKQAEEFAGSPEQYRGIVPKIAGTLARGAPALAAALAAPEAEAPGITAEAAPTLAKIPGLLRVARTVAEQAPRAGALTALQENPDATPAEAARDLAVNAAVFGAPGAVGNTLETRVLSGGGIGALINEIVSRLEGQTPTPTSDLAMAMQGALGGAAHTGGEHAQPVESSPASAKPEPSPVPDKTAALEDALRKAGFDIPESAPAASPAKPDFSARAERVEPEARSEPSTAPATENAAAPNSPTAGTSSPERPIAQQWDALPPEERAVIAAQNGLSGRRAAQVATQAWAELDPGWQALFERRGLEPEPEIAPVSLQRTPEPVTPAGPEVEPLAARERADVAPPVAPEKHATYFANLPNEIGWEQRGGRLLRAAGEPGESDGALTGSGQGDVIGRTTWIPKIGGDGMPSQFWRMRPDRNLTEAQAHEAFRKAARGEPLRPIEQRFIEYAHRTADEYAQTEAEETARFEAEQQEASDIERQRAIEDLRRENARFATADHGEAFTFAQWARRAHDLGASADEIDHALLSGKTTAEKAANLSKLVAEKQHGVDTSAGRFGREGRTGADQEGQAAPAPKGESATGGEDESRTAAAARRGDLFAAPTAREQVAAAERAKDAQRNGQTGKVIPGFEGTDLGAGPAPEQADLASEPHELTDADLTPAEREAFQRQRNARDDADLTASMRTDSQRRGEQEAAQRGMPQAVQQALGDDARVHFVHDEDGLPENVQRRLKSLAEGNIRKGAFDPSTGDVYLFTRHVKDAADAVWTAAHEIAGHKGFRALVNDRAGVKVGGRTPTKALAKAHDMALQNPTVAKLADVIGEQRGSKDRRTMGEEALAELQAASVTGRWDEIARRYGVDVPKGVREGVQGAIRNFVARIKRILTALYAKATGKPEPFTDEDVHAMLAQMREHAGMESRGEGAPLDSQERADDQTETPAFKRWFGNSKVVDAQGKPLVVYHGSKRPDRINKRFRKSRATSGPMAFFTESPEVSSSYATAKADTSLVPPEDYAGWFKYKPRGSAHEVDIDHAWYHLTPEQRATIADRLPRVNNTTPEGNESDTLRLGRPGEFGLTSGDHWQYEIRQAHGNVLKAAKELWLAGGVLFGDESKFMDVLRLGGMDMDRTRFDDPHAEYPAVFPVYLKIEHPLDTSNIPASVVDAVAARARRQRPADEYGADIWAKNTRDPVDWADELRRDVESEGAGHVWTSIPDFVTRTLRELGYDGIKDRGGKNGGVGHTVWVPFDDRQVKSATGNRGTFDPDSASILESSGPQDRAEGEPSEAAPEPDKVLPRSFVSKKLSRLIPGLDEAASAVRMAVTPMAEGSVEARATAKDFANQMREARYRGNFADTQLTKNFSREQLERMWNAADEQSVLEQKGEPTAGKGLDTLAPDERRAVEILQANARKVFDQARALGMVEGEGLPSYTPRMVARMGETGPRPFPDKDNPIAGNVGRNVRTTTGQLKQRLHLTAEETEAAAKAKLGDDAELVRNIRTLPLATAKLSEAVAGRALINRIRDIGKRTGQDTVREGSAPDDGYRWFTIQHPAFTTWRPRFETDAETGKTTAVTDENGNTVFDRVPLYVRGDFAGPLKAVLSEKNGPIYNGLMSLKGKTMSVIMYSPLIHNAVEWGRALPAMPGKVATFRVYFEGNRAKNDPVTMREAINAGLVPIGHRYGFQDISSIQESNNIIPGRSWTAKLLAAVPNLFDKRAGDAVKRAVDALGDVWHNKLLWDRVGDLQMGLYTNFRDRLAHKGFQPETAQRMAAHFANRYAGALPLESMSNAARKIANLVLFSRSFTLGNLGAMKDMVTGLPRDVQSQILRDGGMEELVRANAYSKRKAIAIIAADMALMYLGNSLLQSGIAVARGTSTLQGEEQEYADRLAAAFERVKENPLALLHPFDLAQSLTPMSHNEPGKEDRVLVGHAPDGTAIYMRNPVGKIGEEFKGWLTSPLDMLKRKMGTIARPLYELVTNDKGFGRKVYDPYDGSTEGMIRNAGRIAALFVQDQVPTQSIRAVKNAIQGKGDTTTNILQAAGPLAGVTFSKGAPGGPAVGIAYQAKDEHEFAVNEAMPDIRDLIRAGDTDKAVEKMRALGMPPSYIRWVIRTTENPSLRLSPKGMRDFSRYATPEQRQAMQDALDGGQ